MARLQILELPTEHHGDDIVTPFVLVIDKVQNPDSMLDFLRDPPHLRDELGARTILVFAEEVEIPANSIQVGQHRATPPAEMTGRPTHPDGTPYRYHEIKAGGWHHCSGCRTWGQWTAEAPHECSGTFVHGPVNPASEA